MTTYRAPITGQEPAVFVDLYYDTRERIWTAIMRDPQMNQVGDADYGFGCHGLAEAKKHIESVLHLKLKFKKLDESEW